MLFNEAIKMENGHITKKQVLKDLKQQVE